MSRRDKVLAALIELTNSTARSGGNILPDGFTTEELARHTGILRSNCSAELNTLVRNGLVQKVNGRPTLYRLNPSGKGFATSTLERDGDFAMPSRKPFSEREAGSVAVRTLSDSFQDSPSFDWGVATNRSLHDAVQQAKMALTYPPHGMHILLLGETGVGKSTFSRKMHQYAIHYGVLHKDAPFISFNCSEYTNNPEILLDQLFGHVRGAYTGAHGDKAGLVEQANNGMLFLDEVHRLPPQGQEMLFHLLDYGTFRRLGETELERRARVLLVAATTESPESALLSTFRRRIPVVIRLPALREWSLHDRYELIYSLCREETQILGMPVQISAEALDRLLFSRFPANIGDLKNAIRLACARAFNERMSVHVSGLPGDNVIHVLPLHIVLGLTESSSGVLFRNLAKSTPLFVSPNGEGPPPLPMLEEGSRYAKLDRLSQTLSELGFDTEEILESLERELHKQEQPGVEAPSSRDDLRQFVGEPLFSMMMRAWNEIRERLPQLQEAAFLRIAVHLYGVIRTGRPYAPSGEHGLHEVVERVRSDAPELYQLAGKFLQTFTSLSGTPLPEHETAIVAMLLRPMEAEGRQRIGLVVALFGDGVATTLVESAHRLTERRAAIPLDIHFQTPSDVMDKMMSEAVTLANNGRGVLILTDIPRFADSGDWQPPDGIPVGRVLRPDLRTLVTALQGIQTNRLALGPLAEWLRVRNKDVSTVGPFRTRTVWSCCLTGKGTARAVERLIRDALPVDLQNLVEILPKELGHSDLPLVPDEGLVATVGSVNPGVFGVPFFSVEALLTKEGMDQLLNVLYLGDAGAYAGEGHETVAPSHVIQDKTMNEPVEHSVTASSETGSLERDMEEYIAKLLRRDLVFVNPDLALQVSKEVWNRIESSLFRAGVETRPKRETLVRFCLHTAFVIERLVKQEELVHPYRAQIKERHPAEWSIMTLAWQAIHDVFRIPVNEHELAYLFELVFADRDLEVFHEQGH